MSSISHILLSHKIWLRSRHLTGRPWFILGSAPSPTVPQGWPDDCAHVHVKYAGHSAKALGLPDADLTLLLQKSTPERTENLKISAVLRMRRTGSPLITGKRVLPMLPYGEFEIRYRERDALVRKVAGSLFAELGDEQRPSNGIAMICYAIAMKVPTIVVAGISLSNDGHAYNDDGRKRRHRVQDKAALAALAARYPQLVTSEPELAREVGLPLIERF